MKYNMASNASCVIKKRVQQELNDSAYLISINDCVAKYKSTFLALIYNKICDNICIDIDKAVKIKALNSFGYHNFHNNTFTQVCDILELMERKKLLIEIKNATINALNSLPYHRKQLLSYRQENMSIKDICNKIGLERTACYRLIYDSIENLTQELNRIGYKQSLIYEYHNFIIGCDKD
ncbi:MAG: hypothetical protein RR054_03795 [Clostridia bacterium]